MTRSQRGGRINDLDQALVQDHRVRQEAAVGITAQLLELLITFIGEPLHPGAWCAMLALKLPPDDER